MKYLNYDSASGNISDANGVHIFHYVGAAGIEIKESTDVDNLIKLKNAGFTADEIIAIKKAGLA